MFIGIALSRLGDTFFGVTLAWLALTIGSPRDLGLLILLSGLPRAITAPVAGHLLDRFGPRLMLGVDNLLRGLVLLGIPLLAAVGALRIGYLYPLVVVTGLVASATEVGQEVLVPALVPDAELEPANALLGATFDLAEWAGPATAGLMVSLTGTDPAIYLDAATFLLTATCTTALPAHATLPAEPEPIWTQFTRGFGLLLRYRMLALITLTTVGFLTIDGALQVLWPVYGRRVLGGGPATYGILISAAGVGSLLSSLTLTTIAAELPARLSLPACLAGTGACLIVLPAIHTIPIAVAAAIGVGVLAAPFYPISRAMLQRSIPEHHRGRVFGARIALTTCGFPTGAASAACATTTRGGKPPRAVGDSPCELSPFRGRRRTPDAIPTRTYVETTGSLYHQTIA